MHINPKVWSILSAPLSPGNIQKPPPAFQIVIWCLQVYSLDINFQRTIETEPMMKEITHMPPTIPKTTPLFYKVANLAA